MSNMVIQTNVMALNSHRNLKTVGTKQSQASSRLSSGYRVNSAADDAAGLAISEKMRAQIRGLDMASKNAQDGVSLVQTAEGGMQEIDNMLQRIRELVVQVSNDTNEHNTQGTGDRQKIQDEINQLVSEIDSMSERVEFNKKKLINGDALGSTARNEKVNTINRQLIDLLGATGNAVANAATMGTNGGKIGEAFAAATGLAALAPSSNITAAVPGASTTATMPLTVGLSTASVAGSTDSGTDSIILNWSTGTASEITVDQSSSFTYYIDTMGNTSVTIFSLASSDAEVGTNSEISVPLVSDITSGVDSQAAPTSVGTCLVSQGASTTTAVGSVSALTDLAAADIANREKVDEKINEIDKYISDWEAISGTSMNDADKLALRKIQANLAEAYQATSTVESLTSSLSAVNDLTTGDQLFLQVGANAFQGFDVSISSVKSDVLGIGDGMGHTSIDVLQKSGKDITGILDTLDIALSYVTTERSKLGAVQNRLEYTMKSLDISSENLSASESRIRDADMAKEMMKLTQANVLQQAATSMLAQANQAPQSVLQLLQ